MSSLQSLYAQYKGGAAPSRVVESTPYSQIADLYSVYRNPVLRDAYSGVTSGNYSLSPASMGYLGGIGGSLFTGSPFGGLAGSALGQFAATGAPQAGQDVLLGGLASMLLKTLGVPGLLASLVAPKIAEAIPRLNPAPVEDRTPTQVEPTQTEAATDAISVEPTRADTGHLDTTPAEPLNTRSSDFDTGYASSRGGYEGPSEGRGNGGGADFDTGYAFGGGGYEGPSEGWGGGGYDWGGFGGGGGTLMTHMQFRKGGLAKLNGAMKK